MGSSSGNQTVTNRTEIDPVTQAWRSTIIGAGADLYNRGVPDYYPGSTVTPFSGQTVGGLNYLQNYAQQGATNLDAANASQSRALSGYNPALGGALDASNGSLSNNPAIQNLGQYGAAENPYLQSLFNAGAQQVGNAVNAQFMKAGRFGANDAHQGTMAREMGNLWSQIAMPAYENQQNRGLQAAQAQGSLWDASQNRRLQGTDLLGGIWSQGNEDALRAAALQPSLYQYGMMPGQSMLDVGGMYEDQYGRYLAEDIDRYNYGYNAPWDLLGRYTSMVNGLPDFSGQATTGPSQQPNRGMSALGGAMSGVSMGSSFGWPGAIIGGVLGAAGGYYSDRRLKREIEPLGASINGTPLYRYAYLWDEPGVKRIGVMADEAPPHTVTYDEHGFAKVNYGAL